MNKSVTSLPKIVAEIGCNHMGDISIAKELIDLAVEAGANVAKFQKRNPRELLSESQYNAPHPDQRNSYGNTYGEHREYLEFTRDQHKELKGHCDKADIIYSASVWDVTSAHDIISLEPDIIKIGSPSNTNFKLLEVVRDNYMGDVHISFGMTYHHEEERIIQFFEEKDQAKSRLIIYSCTSGYPIEFEDVTLLEIKRIQDAYGSRIKEIGFSGHHKGIAVDIAAYTLGATWIERHFTKDRTWKGTDHAASLEPQGLKRLVRDLHATYAAMKYKSEEILPVEQIQREKLKYVYS